MNKKLLLFSFYCFLNQFLYGAQTWIDLNFSKKLSETRSFEVNQELEFGNGLNDFYWYQMQLRFNQALIFNISISSDVMFIYRNTEPSNEWVFEVQPGVSARQEIPIPLIFKIFFEEGLFIRIAQKERARICPAFVGGIVLAESFFYSLYIANETVANYFGHGSIDITYFYASLSIKLLNYVFLTSYYSFYVYKPYFDSNWKPANVLGVALTLNF